MWGKKQSSMNTLSSITSKYQDWDLKEDLANPKFR